MNKVSVISKDDELLEAASYWVLKMDESELSSEDVAALQTWLDQHPNHRDVLLEVAAVWDKTTTLSRLADMFPHDFKATEPAERKSWSWTSWSGLAATLSVVIALALMLPQILGLDNTLKVSVQNVGYQTSIGEHKVVLLPDGSEITLNTDSQLSVSFTRNARVLYLARGEVHVRVAEEERPLSVVAADQIVQATGTAFTVEITEEQHVEVLVTEGRVVVGVQSKPAESPDNVSQQSEALVTPPILEKTWENDN